MDYHMDRAYCWAGMLDLCQPCRPNIYNTLIDNLSGHKMELGLHITSPVHLTNSLRVAGFVGTSSHVCQKNNTHNELIQAQNLR